jgi:hypothetical protein
VPEYPVGIATYAALVDFSSGAGEGVGETYQRILTDASGYATFTPFADHAALGPEVSSTAIVVLPPLDVDGDGILEYSGGDRLFDLRALADPSPDVILDAGYTAALAVRASTIGRLTGAAASNPVEAVVGTSETLYVAFNLPIADAPAVRVTDELGNALAAQPQVTVSGDTLAIAFGADPLMPGREYHLQIRATSRVGDRVVVGDFVAPFFTRGLQPAIGGTLTRFGNDLRLEMSEPIGGVTPLGGGDCVVYVEYDLNGTAVLGDYPAELGAASCFPVLTSYEPDPLGPAGYSGYTRYWQISLPTDAVGNPLPSGTRIHLLFSRAVSASARMEKPDGTPVPDVTGPTVLVLP